jgi:hypothetical protein
MSKADYHYTLQGSQDVYFQGNYVCGLRKHVLPLELLRQNETILRSVATSPAGVRRSVPGANRTAEQLRNAREGQLGAMKDGMRPYPRMAPWCLDHPRDYVSLWPLFAKIEEIFKGTLPDELYERQRQLVARTDPDFRLGKSNCSTSAQANVEYDTGGHADNGNIPGTLSMMVLIGQWEGCLFVLPRFRIAVDPEPGDVVFFDPLQVHGNTPLISGKRTSLILFAGKSLLNCRSAEEEMTQARVRSLASCTKDFTSDVRIVAKRNQTLESTAHESGFAHRKIVVAIIAGSGAGKTTLRRQFTNQDDGADGRSDVHECRFANHFECCAQQFKNKEELAQHQRTPGEQNPKRGVYAPYDVRWTLFGNGTAVCGNPKTGADSNGNIDAINSAIDRCLKDRDLVIFDGVMSSKRLIDHLQDHPYPNLGVVWVHLDVSAETAVSRVMKRRQERGKMEMSEATRQGVLARRLRAKTIWEYAKQAYFRTPAKFVVINEGRTPEQIYQQLRTEVENLFSGDAQSIVAA